MSDGGARRCESSDSYDRIMERELKSFPLQ